MPRFVAHLPAALGVLALTACTGASAPGDDSDQAASAGPSAPPEAPYPIAEDGFPERPTPGAPQVFTPPAPTEATLSNGVTLYTVPQEGLPLVSVRLIVPIGAATDPQGKGGMAALGARMLGEGAGERTSLEQAAALDALAADLSFDVGRTTLRMSLDTHEDRLAEALPLAADALLRPRFDAEDWSRVKAQTETAVSARKDDPSSVAALVAARQFWGPEHPYGRPTDGTEASVAAVTLDDVTQWHASELHSGGAAFVVVGAVTAAEAKATLEDAFGSWEGRDRPALEVTDPAGAGKKVLVDNPGASQTVMYAVHGAGGATADPGQRAALDVMATVMGGSFTSRLNRRLREELGYTYGARMRVARLPGGGTLRAGGSMRADATVDALNELTGLLDAAVKDGLTADEVARGRAQEITDVVDRAETRAGLASLYADQIAAGRAPGDLSAWLTALDGIDPGAVSEAADALAAEQRMLVLVGDRSAIEDPLGEAGFEGWTPVGPDGT